MKITLECKYRSCFYRGEAQCIWVDDEGVSHLCKDLAFIKEKEEGMP